MITYEITATVPAETLDAYDQYMIGQHIADVMATGCFTGATYYRDGARRRTTYEAMDQESLDRYLKNDADRLRRHFAEQFHDSVTLTREVWEAMTTI
ncbi:MAG: DUF4286 family protein [Pyrinomonadaceae bacterium]